MREKNSSESQGRMAEWSKALVSGTSHFGGVGSNPTSVMDTLSIALKP